MKCKACCSGLSDECIRALNRLRPIILTRVVERHLKRPDMSSAGFYIQETDRADAETHEPFCEVRLSGVSLTDDRAVTDFLQAHSELERIYEETIRKHLEPGTCVMLFVVLMLDGALKQGMSPLIEGREIRID